MNKQLEETQEIEIPNFVVCQDCMATKPYTPALHLGDETCECGGAMCGCNDCKFASLEHEISKVLLKH